MTIDISTKHFTELKTNVSKVLWPTYFHLDERGFLLEGPGQNPRVTEAGPQQHGHDEEEEHDSEDRDGGRQMQSQVWTSAGGTTKAIWINTDCGEN